MTRTIRDQISDTEIRGALDRSGYLLEARVAAGLRRSRFHVEVSQPYADPLTEKSREIDIVARLGKAVTIRDKAADCLSIELVIECVNPPQPVAFITAPAEVAFSPDASPLSFARLVGWPRHVPQSHLETNWNWLWAHSRLHESHHYARWRVATQFCSFERKRSGDDWYATHRETDHEAFRSLCAAFAYQIGLFYASDTDPWTASSPIQLTMIYPIMVIQGRMLEVRLTRSRFRTADINHVTFLRTYVDRGWHHDYLIDVVTEDFFPNYVRVLRTELNQLTASVRSQYAMIHGVIDFHHESCNRDPRCRGY